MSIIHDALKKIQQGQGTKDDKIWEPEKHDGEPPIEHLPTSPKKARSVLVLLFAIAFFLGALAFSYKQLYPYLYKYVKSAKSSFYKLIHKEEPPPFKTKATKDLVPLARIIVNPPKILNPPGPTNTAGPVNTTGAAKPNPPETFSIHGVMSNGSNNLVLINDQVYQEGDEVNGIKIVKIDLDYIKVINNGTEETIRVKN